MITKTIQFPVLVEDLEAAKAFYTQKFGFTIVREEEFSPDWKYLTVAPQKDNETVIELLEAKTGEQKAQIGKQVHIQLATDDIQKDYAVLKSRGVIFHSAPKNVPGGKGAPFEDLCGNVFDLYQKIS
ncbi:VOC family protein [Sinomicrobium kalidii]|uniref:VOC family protein n=1 Tax=Sinomicrobium kalidii TaxID=2900738 RepID=UPI001E573C70|nr:VOC family protein [Sinomicrobium kalidii]UGU17398.1 VOC family protein [Sinomicrobium kalidii]